ncbi:MAG TPA: hypothetical protein VFQ22_06445 [Longimicrobiales bacterium]|nr:hypothetical protein [Longimicrobiales bacterium]
MRRAAAVVLALVSLTVLPAALSAQEPGGPGSGGGGFELEQNYPNPFNPETTIPFTLSPELFADGRPVVVSVRIFNLLTQPVAYPVALGHPDGAGVELRNLEYTQPGRYEAYWDGTDQSGRQVASGIYFVQLTVNGQSVTRRMLIQK